MSYRVHQITLPEYFGPIRDALVDHLQSGGSEPSELNKLRRWLLEDGWRELCQQADQMDSDPIICFDPSNLDKLNLSDDCLRDHMFLDDDETITNEMRLEYARGVLHSAYGGELSGSFESWCWPMVHVGQLARADGDHILVGMLARFQGLGSGYVAEWCEFFPDLNAVTNFLDGLGYILNVVPEEIDPQILLKQWDLENK